MCLRKLFPNWFKADPAPEPIPDPVVGEKRRIAVLTGINNYPGSVNDLNGCINDIDDVEKKLKAEFPDFLIKKMKDAEVTVEGVFNQIKDILVTLHAGDVFYWHYSGHGTQIPDPSESNGYSEALYLFNGPIIDDSIQTLLSFKPVGVRFIAKFDSCFSADMLKNSKRFKNRFYPMPGVRVRRKVTRKLGKTVMTDVVIISGCGEEQTSADAYINGRYNGAFTYYDLKSFDSNSTYDKEMDKLHTFLPGGGYDQDPTIDGDSIIIGDKVLT